MPVLVTDAATGAWHHGQLQLPLSAPAATGPPSEAVMARLAPLLRAHGDALAAQAHGLDPERLSRTYAALMAGLQEASGMHVHAVELTPYTLRNVLPGGGEPIEGQDYERGDEDDWETGPAQLYALPEGLRALAGELQELKVRSSRLVGVPGWGGS